MQAKFLLCAFLAAGLHSQAQNGSPYWSLSGNSNATSASRLGTINAMPLYLTTNNASRIYIAPNGNVGIGTTTPASLFNVQGPTLLSIFTSTDALGPTSGSGIIGYTKFMPTAAGQRLGYFLTGSQNNGVDPGNGTGMVGYSDGAWSSNSHPTSLAFETAKSGSRTRSEAMRITSNGYVGIGTANPTYRLHSSDSSVGIYAEGVGSNAVGLLATGGNYGIFASGRTAIYGSGTTGVSAYGTSEGMHTSGGLSGIYASGTTYGVNATGPFAVYGVSSSAGGNAIYGVGSGYQCYGGYFSSSSAIGVFGITSNTSSWAGYFSGTVYTSGAYTGSDQRLKKNVETLTDAVSIINKLQPKSYEYRTDGKMAQLNLPKGKHYGLIAQELETVLPDLVKEAPQNPLHDTTRTGASATGSNADQQTFKAVNYTELIPILIKGIQEQEAKLLKQDQQIETLTATVQKLEAMINNSVSGPVSSASLDVATPNPAKSSAIIGYRLPQANPSAKLIMVNMSGQVLKEFTLAGVGGKVNLNVSNLASGSYPCTLWVNGQPVVSKQLVVAH